MPNLAPNLELPRCPHCSVAAPHLKSMHSLETTNHQGGNPRKWNIYKCGSCGGVVSAASYAFNGPVIEHYPSMSQVADEIPDRPRTFLQQAQESLHAPAGSVMLCASAVDAMLKMKGYVNGSLYSRIEQAVKDHLITPEMADWAHQVRLDANDQRHADEAASLPTQQDAKRILDFAAALAEFMFVLPGRIQRGLEANN